MGNVTQICFVKGILTHLMMQDTHIGNHSVISVRDYVQETGSSCENRSQRNYKSTQTQDLSPITSLQEHNSSPNLSTIVGL